MVINSNLKLGGGGLTGVVTPGANIGTGLNAGMPTNIGSNNGGSMGFTVNTNKKTGQIDYTYNKNYPGFDKEDYEILVRMADKSGLTGQDKKDLMDELYMQYLPQVNQKHMLDKRQQIIKEQAYESKDYQGDEKKVQETKVKLAELSQKAKKKYGIDASTSDEEVINAMANNIPNGGQLLEDYINNGDKEIFYEAGLISGWGKVAQGAKNFMGAIGDSVTGLGQFAGNVTADAVGWVAKKLGADENKVNDLVQEYKDYAQAMKPSATMGADTNTPLYNLTKGAADVIQVIGGEGIAKGAIQSTAKGAKVLNTLKNAPTWQKMIAGGLEGAGDMTLYNIISEGELPSTTEMGEGAAIGAVLPGAGAVYKASKPIIKKTLGKTASQLQLSGLLNPAKLNTIKNQLIEEGTDLAQAGLKGGTAEDVGKYMIERDFKGDKTTIINKAGEHAKKAHNLKREVLSSSDTLHDVPSAKKALEVIRKTIDGVPGLESKLSRVEKLIGKEKHTLSELDEIKSILDDTKDLYTIVGDPKGGAVNKGLVKVRQDLRKYIEDAADKEGLGNIKMLNNETQVANLLKDAISRKDSADAAREMLSVFSKSAIGGAAGYNVGPFDTDTLGGKVGNIIIGALAGKYLFSTKSKTKLASLLNKMSGGSKKELERLVAGDLAVKDLSKTTKDKLVNIFKKVGPNGARTPKEFEQQEFEALLKKYSYGDIPALEFKEGVNDAGKNILVGGDKKIIATPSGANLREGQITDVQLINKPNGDIDNYIVKNDNINPVVNEKTGETLSEAIEKLKNQGWNEESINKYKDAILAQSKGETYKAPAKTLDDLIEPFKGNIKEVYHGTKSESADKILKEGFKYGSELPENSYRGGGYDSIQDVVSFSTSKKNADVFSKVSGKGTTLLSKIKKGANIVKMKGIEYAEELSEYLPELKKRGIDGVILDNGENEFVVINKNIIGKTSKATK